MKRRLKASEAVHAGLCRIAQTEVALVGDLAAHPTPDRAEDVHAVRVVIKRQRATWRLLRPLVGEQVFLREDRRLAQAADNLAPQRDRIVARQTLASLLEETSEAGLRRTIRRLVQRLSVDELFEHNEQQTEQALRQAHAAVQISTGCLTRQRLPDAPWSCLAPGFTQTYTKTRKSLAVAYEQDTGPVFHGFRKHLKRLQYQLELLRGAWPKRIRRLTKNLRKLNEALGDDHDLMVLQQILLDDPATRRTRNLKQVVRLLQRHSQSIRKDCRGQLFTLLNARPKVFIDDLAQHFHAWHRAAPPQLHSPAAPGLRRAINAAA